MSALLRPPQQELFDTYQGPTQSRPDSVSTCRPPISKGDAFVGLPLRSPNSGTYRRSCGLLCCPLPERVAMVRQSVVLLILVNVRPNRAALKDAFLGARFAFRARLREG